MMAARVVTVMGVPGLMAMAMMMVAVVMMMVVTLRAIEFQFREKSFQFTSALHGLAHQPNQCKNRHDHQGAGQHEVEQDHLRVGRID